MWKVKEWLRPASPEQAAQLLAELGPKARAVAGGTRIAPSPDVEFLVDLSKLPLKEAALHGGLLHLGSGTSLQALTRLEPVRALAGGVLATAAEHSYTALMRNRATLGGEIATAEPTSEILAALVALQASVELLMPHPHTVSISDYLADPKAFSAALITAVTLRTDWKSGGFSRVARTVSDRPIVSAAFAFRGDAPHAIGSLGLAGGSDRVLGFTFEIHGPVGWDQVAPIVEPMLDPPSDIRGSSQYRRMVIPVAIRRAIQTALEVTQ